MSLYCPECYHENPDNTIFCEKCGCPFDIKEKKTGERLYKDRYKIISPLSAGGVGEIFLTYDIRLNKTCVIKKIQRKVLKDLAPERREEIAKPFEREAQILASVRHPNLPCVTDYFVENDGFYLVMDYIEGDDLEIILEEHIKLEQQGQGLEEKQVVEWAIQVCRVLEYLHSQKPPIVHGDVKTANIIIRNIDGLVVLVDFGTATIQTVVGEGDEPAGSEGYAAPEQYLGKQEIRSDIYSLGATMYELLLGHLPEEPFKFTSIREVIPELTKDTEEILERCLKYTPQERFNNARELKQALLASYKKNFVTSRKHKTGEFILKEAMDYEKKRVSPSKDINVFIVDDDINIRLTFESIEKLYKSIKIVGVASNGKEAVETIKIMEEKPHVILMDRDMPVMDGIEATGKIIEFLPSVRIIVLTGHPDQKGFVDAFNAGAAGYIIKGDISWAELEKYIQSAFAGETPVSPAASTLLLTTVVPGKNTGHGAKEKLKSEYEPPKKETKREAKSDGESKTTDEIKNKIEVEHKATEKEGLKEKVDARKDKTSVITEEEIEKERIRDKKLTELLMNLENPVARIRKRAVIELAEFGDRRAIIALREARKKEGPLSFAMKSTIDKAIKKLEKIKDTSSPGLLLTRVKTNEEYEYITRKFSPEDVKAFDKNGYKYVTMKFSPEDVKLFEKDIQKEKVRQDYDTNTLPPAEEIMFNED